METFNELKLPPALLTALGKMKFSKPTPIQAQAIPLALEGRDVLGSAQTGTGKTAAFAIPLLAHLISKREATALVMTPTRELAAQVVEAVKTMLDGNSHIKTALLIGGDSMYRQLQQLKSRPRIIVGTPGRINDHLQQGTLDLTRADFLVLDETDRMLDMGFEVQIERIVNKLPKKRQTLLFSATLPSYIVKMADRYQHNAARVAVGAVHLAAPKIKQELMQMQVAEKYDRLLEQLASRAGSIIVFVRTKRGADKLAKKLVSAKHAAAAIHGDLNQNQRTRVIQAFRDMKHRVMVATDVAARGLDIPHIAHVINYDLPQQPEDYIHRIGRTARAGAEGSAVCFITPEDRELWSEIHFLMNPGEKRDVRVQPMGRQGGRMGGRPGGGHSPSGKAGAGARRRRRSGGAHGPGQRQGQKQGQRQEGQRQGGGRTAGHGQRQGAKRR